MTDISTKVANFLQKFSPLTLKDLVKMVGEEPEPILEVLSAFGEETKVATEYLELEHENSNCNGCSANSGETYYRWIH